MHLCIDAVTFQRKGTDYVERGWDVFTTVSPETVKGGNWVAVLDSNYRPVEAKEIESFESRVRLQTTQLN